MRRGLAGAVLALSAFVAACATSPQGAGRPLAAPRAEVTRQGDTLHLRYELDRDAPVWAFQDSALITGVRVPWRPRQWQVMTPGVRLERAGHYDILVSEDGGPVPRSLDIRIRPEGVDLEAEYRTLVFSNGAVALPTGQFSVFPLSEVQVAAALPSDLNQVVMAVGPTQVTWRDEAGPVLYAGERRPYLITRFERAYVLMGEADVTRGEALTAVIDPALPSWMADTLAEAAPATVRWYRQKLGAASAGADRPVLMASWSGPADRHTSMAGSVLPGLIVMNFEGRGIATPDERIRDRALWFIAHEAAHFWLGQTVRYEYARDAWITEGAADLMAVRALKARDPAYDDRAELENEINDCIRLAGKPLESAGDRGEHRAYYACGAVFAMAAEIAERQNGGGDFFDFIRGLMDENRADGAISAEEWLQYYVRRGGSAQMAGLMREMLERGVADPAEAVRSLLWGMDTAIEDGRVVLR